MLRINLTPRLFCIEGPDGSGKETQVAELEKRLIAESCAVKTMSFPRYETPTGKLVKEYLTGKFGDPNSFNPWISSMFFADDRQAAAPQIKQYLAEGNVVILNRYVPSNAAHQGGKINDPSERKIFVQRILRFEYEVLELPRPSLTVILDVTLEMSLANLQKRAVEKGLELDGHETLVHIKNARDTYYTLQRLYPEEFLLIVCCENGQMAPVGNIHEIIWKVFSPYLKAR